MRICVALWRERQQVFGRRAFQPLQGRRAARSLQGVWHPGASECCIHTVGFRSNRKQEVSAPFKHARPAHLHFRAPGMSRPQCGSSLDGKQVAFIFIARLLALLCVYRLQRKKRDWFYLETKWQLNRGPAEAGGTRGREPPSRQGAGPGSREPALRAAAFSCLGASEEPRARSLLAGWKWAARRRGRRRPGAGAAGVQTWEDAGFLPAQTDRGRPAGRLRVSLQVCARSPALSVRSDSLRPSRLFPTLLRSEPPKRFSLRPGLRHLLILIPLHWKLIGRRAFGGRSCCLPRPSRGSAACRFSGNVREGRNEHTRVHPYRVWNIVLFHVSTVVPLSRTGLVQSIYTSRVRPGPAAGLPSGSAGKNPPAALEPQEPRVPSLGEGTATPSSALARRTRWTEEPAGLQSTGLQTRTRLRRRSTCAPCSAAAVPKFPRRRRQGVLQTSLWAALVRFSELSAQPLSADSAWLAESSTAFPGAFDLSTFMSYLDPSKKILSSASYFSLARVQPILHNRSISIL